MPDPALTELSLALTEKLGIAGLFLAAIYAGVVVARAYITAMQAIELARIAVQQSMAAAIQTQAGAAQTFAAAQADGRRVLEEQAIMLRLIAQRVGLSWPRAAADQTSGGKSD